MSKKKKSKFRKQFTEKNIESPKKDEKKDEQDLSRDFKFLGFSIGIVVIILISVYYFNQKDNILEGFANYIFSLF